MNCCYECKNRVIGCHANCEIYIEWSRKKSEARIAKQKDDELEATLISFRRKKHGQV